MAIYLFKRYCVAGWIDAAEYPLTLLRPYLNLKPPFLNGCVKTGLPATKSDMYVKLGVIFFCSPSFFVSFAFILFCNLMNSSKKPHSRPNSFPHTDNLARSFGAF